MGDELVRLPLRGSDSRADMLLYMGKELEELKQI
jgi:hypothetical protein